MSKKKIVIVLALLLTFGILAADALSGSCTDCYTITVPWWPGTEIACLDLDDGGYQHCIEDDDLCILLFRCNFFP